MQEFAPREINYLRMSITDRCNLRCSYCSYWKEWEKLPSREMLSYEELLRIAAVAAKVGIRKIRVTGGGHPFSEAQGHHGHGLCGRSTDL